MKHLITLCVLTVLTVSCQSKKKTAPLEEEPVKTVNYLEESEADFNKRMTWWRDARYGMFIHWGVYAVPAGEYQGKPVKGIGEWIMQRGQIPVKDYEAFAKAFNPVKFDADAWVKLIRDAGMKYLVITSKHHDGFALWDSKVSDYDMVDFAPYGKDVLKALSEACKKYGIKFGLYHSIMDWHHKDAQVYSYLKDDPNKREDNSAHFANYLEHYMKPQLKELIENYDPAILWFDGEWVNEFKHEQGQALYQYVRSLKPDILVNNRVDKGRQGMQGMNKEDADYAGDFGTPEQEILETKATVDWESCMTMNDTWGFKKDDHNWKSAETLIHNLIDVVAKGGNYLLNVGPTAEGLIPEPSVERLQETGNWLKVNGEAVYETESFENHYKQGEAIRFIKKKGSNDLYVAVLKKPEANLTLNHVKPETDSSINILGNETVLEWTFDNQKGLTISIPETVLNRWNDKTYAWVFHIKGEEK
ncbi:alpha-L-fucosidase [Snuella lapsa]|uniref:alpha-L-fucosidase n=1 Tax=Snuella lapsa TaxID=870481 RepID=A0ABP6Y3Z4_9FLAO